jgi:chromate transporter
VFAPLSLLSIGGGQSAIPEMQHQSVTVHGWMTDSDFADLFAISRAAPGPSTLIVALIGWQVCGLLGAVIATLAIFLPSSILMYSTCSWWNRNADSPVRLAIQAGLAPVAVGLIFAGAITVLRSAHAGVMGIMTAAIVCVLQSTTNIGTYLTLALIAAAYLCFYFMFPRFV